MKHKGFVTLCLTLTASSIYLLVSAPAPLEATNTGKQATIPIERVFDAVNAINARARQIYTKEIVGAGKAVGLAFDEDWQEVTAARPPVFPAPQSPIASRSAGCSTSRRARPWSASSLQRRCWRCLLPASRSRF
jgi:hypothetical protein